MSEVLTLAVEELVPLGHKAVNDCLLKFPGLRCEPVSHVVLDVIVRGREVWTLWRVTENLPLKFLQECRDCVGRMRPCIVVEKNELPLNSYLNTT